MADENSGRQLKIYKDDGLKASINAWPNKKVDDAYLHANITKQLGSGNSAVYEGYNLMNNMDNTIGDTYNQGYIQNKYNDIMTRAIADEYAGKKRLGASIGYNFVDGLEAHIERMKNQDDGKTKDTAYMYKYVPGGRLKVEASRKQGLDPEYRLLFNKRF